MTLYQRTILIIVSTFIALFFILGVSSDFILLKSFTSLERVVVADHIQIVKNEIEESYDELLADSLQFRPIISSKGSTSVSTIPLSTLQSHHIDIVICFSRDGQIKASLFAKGNPLQHPAESGRFSSLLANIVSLVQKSPEYPLSGLIFMGARPLQLVVSPIPDTEFLLMTGRYLDSGEINRISALTEFAIELVPVADQNHKSDVASALAAVAHGDDSPVQVVNPDTVVGYTLFKDIFDRPALLVKITEERLLYKQGKASIIYILGSLFITGAVFCCVMLFFMRSSILNRLVSLTQRVLQITTHGDISERLPVSEQQDELKNLAVSINSMLDSLENAEHVVRESEERYRLLFDRAPDAILIIGIEGDEAGRIMAANQAAADQHGYTLEELCSLYIYDLNNAETNKLADGILAAVANGEWVNAEIWHQKKDGTLFPIEIHAGLIKVGGKKYALGFDRDIMQRKITEEMDHLHLQQVRQLNEELKRKAIDLAAANNELEAFNYSVSHDMRGPLTRISGYCQLLLDDDNNLDTAAREYIAKIYESEIWLNDMIDALLQLARLTRVEIVAGTVNLSEIADEALKELALEFPDRTVRTHVMPDIVVDGDNCLLKMVMLNLMNNAWKYSAENDDSVIEFGFTEADEGRIYYVRDNGAGFNMKDAGKLFRVFSRLHDSSRFVGTGIGLATVQRIIFRHGGRIWAEAEPGNGATFFFTLS